MSKKTTPPNMGIFVWGLVLSCFFHKKQNNQLYDRKRRDNNKINNYPDFNWADNLIIFEERLGKVLQQN